MINTENSQLPCAEDISFDSLEYLFGSASNNSKTIIPWVEIQQSQSEQITAREAQIQLALKILQKQNLDYANQMHTLYILIGYMQALLQEKESQLKTLSELQFKAAESVAWRLEANRHKEKVEELEKEITRLSQNQETNLEEILKNRSNQITVNELLSTLLPWLVILVLSVILGIVYLSS